MERRGILHRVPVTRRAAEAARGGFALEQVAIAIAIVAILLAGTLLYIPGRREQAIAAQTVRDAQAIADAAVRYRWRTGAWPSRVMDLTAYELPRSLAPVNRFGFSYDIAGNGRHVAVTTHIPLPAVPTSAGTGVSTVSAGGETVVTVSRTLTDDGLATAVYSKKHLYGE
jgi:hypothetical protein